MREPIQAVEVSYFIHPTEDAERVRNKVRSCLGIETEPEQNQLRGHFGYAILQVRYHLLGDEASHVTNLLATGLTSEAKKALRESIQGCIDEHSALYLRLDKQEMMEGKLVLGESDSVRVKIKPRLFQVKGGITDFYIGVLKLIG